MLLKDNLYIKSLFCYQTVHRWLEFIVLASSFIGDDDGVVITTVSGAQRITIERWTIELTVYKGLTDQQWSSVNLRSYTSFVKNFQNSNRTIKYKITMQFQVCILYYISMLNLKAEHFIAILQDLRVSICYDYWQLSIFLFYTSL